MSFFGNSQTGDEARISSPPEITWKALRRAIKQHPSITKWAFTDEIMRAEFKTGMTLGTYGQNLSASVSPYKTGSRISISGVAKWQTMGGRDQARVRKVAGELLTTVAKMLADRPPTAHGPEPEPSLARVRDASVADELFKLVALRDSGVLSTEEFEVQKARLIE